MDLNKLDLFILLIIISIVIASILTSFQQISIPMGIAIIGILSSVVLASLNTARQKSRDARRIADVGQLELALELYFDSNSAYPAALTALSPTFIPVDPDPPQGETAYGYVSASPFTTYCLGAILEDTGHPNKADECPSGVLSTHNHRVAP